jgi:MOSC domain-containing protein YiiM
VTSSGRIHKLSVSSKKGVKKHNVRQVRLIPGYGIDGDAHGGTERQVSLLPYESFSKVRNYHVHIKPGDFAENITTIGFDLSGAKVGQTILLGNSARLMITHLGKECHRDCFIKQVVGDCIMPREGVFARVVNGGVVREGDPICWE